MSPFEVSMRSCGRGLLVFRDRPAQEFFVGCGSRRQVTCQPPDQVRRLSRGHLRSISRLMTQVVALSLADQGIQGAYAGGSGWLKGVSTCIAESGASQELSSLVSSNKTKRAGRNAQGLRKVPQLFREWLECTGDL